MERKILSLLLGGLLLLAAFPLSAFAEEGVSYRYYDEVSQSWAEGTVSAEAITSGSTAWGSNNWYIAKGEIEVNGRVNIQGTANLILAYGCKLGVKGGIRLQAGNTLNIYAQNAGTGALSIQGAASNNAGIGGNNGENGGTLSIYGGVLNVAGGFDASGIGGGRDGNGGTIRIYDGTITVNGGDWGAGIGGGGGAGNGSGGTITILGGYVKAAGGKGGAGIGGGSRGSGNSTRITISGGVIEAQGGNSAAGIGGGRNEYGGNEGTGGSITITGGTVRAAGGDNGAGIGGGGGNDRNQNGANGGTITISGGAVTAVGGSNSAGIGGGGGSQKGGSGGNITISGGTVDASGGSNGAGIGAGNGSSGGMGDNGTFSTGDHGNAVITTPSISDSGDASAWSGIIFQGNTGQAGGDAVTPGGNFEIPSGGGLTVLPGSTLTVPAGSGLTIPPDSTLMVPEGSTLVISKDAVLNNDAVIEVSGTLEADGFTGNGSISFKENGILQMGNGVQMSFPGGGTLGADGGITADTIQMGDTTITLPAGSKMQLDPDGTVFLPGGAVIQKAGGSPVTIPDGGGQFNPVTGEITENMHPDTSDRPNAGNPFIQNNSGVNVWQPVKDRVEKADNGSTVTVDMNGNTIVPGAVLDLLRGRDVTLVLLMENGIRWSMNGKTMKAGKLRNTDFSVLRNTGKIPAEIVELTAGENYRMELGFRFKGTLGFTAVLSVDLGDQNAGLRARLYQYNESTGQLELVRTAQVSDDGTLELPFTQTADYLVVTEKGSAGSNTVKPVPPAGTGNMKSPAGNMERKSPNTGER